MKEAHAQVLPCNVLWFTDIGHNNFSYIHCWFKLRVGVDEETSTAKALIWWGNQSVHFQTARALSRSGIDSQVLWQLPSCCTIMTCTLRVWVVVWQTSTALQWETSLKTGIHTTLTGSPLAALPGPLVDGVLTYHLLRCMVCDKCWSMLQVYRDNWLFKPGNPSPRRLHLSNGLFFICQFAVIYCGLRWRRRCECAFTANMLHKPVRRGSSPQTSINWNIILSTCHNWLIVTGINRKCYVTQT